MQVCWEDRAASRPTFAVITKKLKEIKEHGARSLSLVRALSLSLSLSLSLAPLATFASISKKLKG
jgi:hypothetical protein